MFYSKYQFLLKKQDQDQDQGWVQWLMLVIPVLWETEGGGITKSGVQDQPGQDGETLSLLKIQKLARRGGERL